MKRKYENMKEVFDYINTLEKGKINPFSVVNKYKKVIPEEQILQIFSDISWKNFESQEHICKYFIAVMKNYDKKGNITRKDRQRRDIEW